MKNALTTQSDPTERILLVGRTGSGKTSQIWTLPGRRFAYILDPNSLKTLQGCDLDYELFLPEFTEMDATLKGFNKGAKDDRPPSKKEPTLYTRWVEDINEKEAKGFFKNYDWLCIDSLTFLSKSVMNRQLYINNRYGGLEDLGDYRVVGSKLNEVFSSITSLPINLYCTGHIDSYQDEKSQKIETQLRLPGSARAMLPLMFTDIWQASYGEEKGVPHYTIRTRPDTRGLQDIRSSLSGLGAVEDVTIKKLDKDATNYGIGALLRRHAKPVAVQSLDTQRSQSGA